MLNNNETPQERTARVDCLRDAIQNGTYQVPPDNIAERIIERVGRKPVGQMTEAERNFVSTFYSVRNEEARKALRTEAEMREERRREVAAFCDLLNDPPKPGVNYLDISNAIGGGNYRRTELRNIAAVCFGVALVVVMVWLFRGGNW